MTGKEDNAAALFEDSVAEAGSASGLLLPLLSLAMGLCASYPWLLWLGVSFSTGSWTRPILSYQAAAVLSVAGLFMNYFFQKRPWPLGLIRAAVLCGGFVLIALVWLAEYGPLASVFSGGRPSPLITELFNLQRPYLLALLAAALFWWQGLARGSSRIYFSNLYASFGWGLTALVLLVLLLNWQIPRLELPGLLSLQESAAAYLAAFFLLGLAALSLGTHQSFTGGHVTGKALARIFNRRWLMLLAVLLGMIILGGAVLTGAVSFELWALLLRLLAPVSAFLGMIIHYSMVPFSHAAEWAVNLLKLLMGAEQEQPPDSETILPSPTATHWEGTLRTLTPEALAVIQWILLALLLGVLTFFIARSIKARSGKPDNAADEFHESFFSWAILKKDLLRLRGLIRRPYGAGSRARAAMQRMLPRGSGFRSMRELYRALLQEASRRGLERFAPETPYEYGDRLGRDVPAAAGELLEITERYAAERYGQHKYTSLELSESAAGWRKIRAALRQFADGS